MIQCGIVDCAPRPVPRTVKRLIGASPALVREQIVSVLHRNRPRILGSGISFCETSPRDFRRTVDQWLAHSSAAAGVVVVNIAPTNAATESHSPGLGQAIGRYNEILHAAVHATGSSRFKLADVHAAIPPGATDHYISATDGHHITAAGHALYASEIEAVLRTLLSDVTADPKGARE